MTASEAAHGVPPCTHCGAEPGSSLACLACGELLEEPAGGHVFARLGLAPGATVDTDAIELRYLKLSRLLHPDFQTGRPQEHQDRAVAASARLNEAYKTLLDDQLRLEAALALHDPEALERNKTLSPAFLMESMESSEELEEVREDGDTETLRRLTDAFQGAIDTRMAAAAAQLDGEPDIDAVATLLHETRVYRRMLRDSRP